MQVIDKTIDKENQFTFNDLDIGALFKIDIKDNHIYMKIENCDNKDGEFEFNAVSINSVGKSKIDYTFVSSDFKVIEVIATLNIDNYVYKH